MPGRLLTLAAGVGSIAGGALAQEPPAAGGVADVLVVVGTRAEPRLATETAAPVDVFTGAELAERGYSDLSRALAFVAPAFNFPRAASGPSSAGARPATLRGLSPDQVLVLVNGRRRHASSIINFNNTVGRGSVVVDFNTIPIAAVERIEILRDGAAAQYGSDAIAGVVNIVLKSDAEGGAATVQYGEAERGDGQTVILTARKGLALDNGGFLTLVAEARDRGDTNAAEIDPRFGRITSALGDPASTDLQAALNAEAPLAGATALFGFVTVSQRNAESSPLFRAPTVAPTFYPNGFLPVVGLDVLDVGGAVGVRGELAGWRWELSDAFGLSDSAYEVSNTVNTSLGAASPRDFFGGGARYSQNLINLAASRRFDVAAGLDLAAGLEHRQEAYEIVPGDPLSFALAGAQGFPGFNPPSPVDVDRDAVSVFVDGELRIIDTLRLGAAVRYEDYSDFGEQTTGKASAFWAPLDWLALRATASTGFRAPSLQQQFFSTVTSQRLPSGQIANVGNFAVTDPVSVALGASPLRPETSASYSAGFVLTPVRGLSLSVDAYRVDISDRISLSENIQGAQVNAILLANGITNASVARFFTNAADTTSKGWEATARWATDVGADGRLQLTFAYGSFDSDVESLAVNPVLPAVALLGPASIGLLTDAQPRNKTLLGARYDAGRWSVAADAVRFGSYRVPTSVGDQTLEGSTSFDLTATFAATDAVFLSLGVLNAGDEYPARQAGDTTGRPYSEADPLGFNGREYFARLAVEF
jgi:iron complex outermembrane receptor protein